MYLEWTVLKSKNWERLSPNLAKPQNVGSNFNADSRIQKLQIMYDDNSPFLESGKYKFSSLKNVPATYLLNIQKSVKDKDLINYIDANLEKLQERALTEKQNVVPKVLIKCDKISYQNEKEAMKEIIRIAKRNQENKKPVRIYKCFCGAFHLTSKKFSEL